ncbi:dTDP-4-dehydrorhamnose 3,5-epimerase [Acetobacter musti]|uniref:dTDP-4-dehydrorhamnose 3,5-epimerase n=1 Tax=Acetobacter musti TaxID=864732 RepID=A0ABX0JUQ3_9PROT|nr:dTDP-4-dehydrorhamnose 3,5-epimerase [Acetobacter musti]
MIFEKTSILDMWKIKIKRESDERGSFGRIFCEDLFRINGLESKFIQISSSRSNREGIIRGMHLQHSPSSEVKLVQCIKGGLHDVVCDVRPWSSTYLAKEINILHEQDDQILYIPKGCLHGFQTLQPNTEVYYSISTQYDPINAAGIRYDDPILSIKWPLPPTCISNRDRELPFYTHDFLK